jgi:hypothetical protein
LSFLYDSATKSTDVVGSDSLRFTTTAGFAGAVTAIVGALLPILDKITALKVSENIKIAAIGLIGAGVLAWAIASAGDVLARAYATAHVHPADGDTPPTPATEWAVSQVLDILRNAAPALQEDASKLTEAVAGSRDREIIPLAGGVKAKYKQHRGEVYAVRRDASDPTKLEYLFGRETEMPAWASEDDLEVA